MSGGQKICPQCGTEYELDRKFCPNDGTALRSTTQGSDLVGSIVADRYHVLKKLGEGGMGQVYLAEHVKMLRKSALKVMHPGMLADADAVMRFNREATNASRINHPNVAAIYDFGETKDGITYLAMEFVEGQSLTSLIEQQGALPAPRAADIARQAAEGLALAHDMDIVHRDLKPDNIMLAKNRDGSDCVKVVDFGIAKAGNEGAQKVTKTGLVVGTPEYMSPEQLAGDKLDGRSDIYSLGLVAFNMLTGKLPFPSETVQEAMIMRLTDRPRTLAEMRPDIQWPPALQQVMDRVLARDVALRYQKASEFGRDIVRAVEGMPAAISAQMGTQVVDASGLPATRVANAAPSVPTAVNAGATRAVDARPAPAVDVAPVRSRAPLYAGGGVAAAALVGVVLFTSMSKGKTTDSTAAGTTPTTQSSSPQSNGAPGTQQPGVATPVGSPSAGTGRSGAAASNGGTTQPFSRKADPAAVRTVQAKTTGAGGSSAAALATLEHLRVVFGKSHNATEDDAREALHQIDGAYASLPTHDDKMEALVFKATAYGILDPDAKRACQVLAQILDEPRSSSTQAAQTMRSNACQ